MVLAKDIEVVKLENLLKIIFGTILILMMTGLLLYMYIVNRMERNNSSESTEVKPQEPEKNTDTAPQRSGAVRILIGLLLTALQLVSAYGNYKSNTSYTTLPASTGQLAYDMIAFIASNFVGIIGIVLLITGIIARCKTKSKK